MKFTDADLAKAMGLKVGDRIKFYAVNCVCVIDKNYQLYDERARIRLGSIVYLINEEFEILTPKKKVGELSCCDFTCENCPLAIINCLCDEPSDSLYKVLSTINEIHQDQEIYDIIKKRLDKEVE